MRKFKRYRVGREFTWPTDCSGVQFFWKEWIYRRMQHNDGELFSSLPFANVAVDEHGPSGARRMELASKAETVQASDFLWKEWIHRRMQHNDGELFSSVPFAKVAIDDRGPCRTRRTAEFLLEGVDLPFAHVAVDERGPSGAKRTELASKADVSRTLGLPHTASSTASYDC